VKGPSRVPKVLVKQKAEEITNGKVGKKPPLLSRNLQSNQLVTYELMKVDR
jgi:hypothetical protein